MRRIILPALCASALCWNALLATTEQPGKCDDPPYAFSDLEELVKSYVPAVSIRQRIENCGVTFILDAAGEASLRKLMMDAAGDGAGRAAANIDEVLRLLVPPRSPRAAEVWRPRTDRRDMVWVPAGEFQMGSPDAERGRDADETAHTTSVPGFWLDQAEVTNEAFRRFVIANPRWQKDRIDAGLHDGKYLASWTGNDYPANTGDQPVVSVSWHAAMAYASWAGKRLPTEAEWEYAARAGATGMFWWGDAFDGSRANNSASLLPAGSARGNAWGLFDMLGNAAEWVSSRSAPYPFRRDDGREQREGSDNRVIRGGSWNSGETFLRLANRNAAPPATTSDRVGFRCAY